VGRTEHARGPHVARWPRVENHCSKGREGREWKGEPSNTFSGYATEGIEGQGWEREEETGFGDRHSVALIVFVLY